MAEKPMRMIGGMPTWEDWNKLLDYVEARTNIQTDGSIEMSRSYAGVALSVTRRTATASYFWAQITGSTADGDRFIYDFAEVEKDTAGNGGWITKTDGITGTAYNGAENPTGVQTALPNDIIVQVQIVGSGEDAEYWISDVAGGGGDSEPNSAASLKLLGALNGTQDIDTWAWNIDSKDQEVPNGVRFNLITDLLPITDGGNTISFRMRTVSFDENGRLFLVDEEGAAIEVTGQLVDISLPVVIDVSWDGTALRQTKRTIHVLGTYDAPVTTIIDTSTTCS